MNDIAFSVIINNDGIDDIIFKTIMLKGEKGDKGDAGGAQIDDSTTASNTTWSSQKINSEISSMPDNLSELEDVELDTITDGQMFGYDLTSGKWKNKDADASSLKYNSNTSIKDKIDEKADTAGLSEVATSGDYDDLTNKPQLASVATSGDYDDLSNKPKAQDISYDGGATTVKQAIDGKMATDKIKTYIWNGTNIAITTLYSGGNMYYCDISFPSGDATDSAEILSLIMVDYGGLSDVLQFQIKGARAFRIWSKTSMTLSTLTVKVLYFT